MENLPDNFISWYLKIGIADFLNHRQSAVWTTWKYLNIPVLTKTLFTPYHRIHVEKGSQQKYGAQSAFDQLTFNLLSTVIGIFVRLTLIVSGLIIFFLYSLFSILYCLIVILIPIFSIPHFLNIKSNTIFERDLQSPQKLTKKITSSKLFKHLSLFFEEDFKKLFENLSENSTTLVKPGQNISQAISELAKTPAFSSFLAKNSLKPEQFNLLLTTLDFYQNIKPKPHLTPIGQTLAFGYTKTLERFARPISGQDQFITQSEKEAIEEIEKILTRPQNNNVILVGEVGVGRHSVVQNLANAISNSHLPTLSAKQLLYLDTIAMAGSGKNLQEVKSNFELILNEAKGAGNVILIIDQIDKILTSRDERIDLTEPISLVIKEHDLPIIGITTPDEFSQYIRTNPQIAQTFEKIDLEEPNSQDILEILIGRAQNAAFAQKVFSNLNALTEIVTRSNQLQKDKKQPQKALTLFDELVAQNKKITVDLVDELIGKRTKTPVGAISKSETSKLKDLESILHKRVIGQEEAVEEISKAMRRARTEVENSQKPIGSFLFLGPTGVGKTETAKALAEAYFGKEDQMVRLDMSEYQGDDGLLRLIGNAATKSPGILANQMRDHPFGILLLDEFEKANPQIHNLFLQVLDEGYLTDAFGKKVNFDNIIIIATSNAGAEFIRQQLSSGKTSTSKELTNYVLEKGLFTPELINRFDGVVVYHPLTPEEIVQVTTLMLKQLSKKLKENKNITLEITAELTQKVAQSGYDPQFGARPIRRLIQDKIEDEIAKMIIDEKVKNGDTIEATKLLTLF